MATTLVVMVLMGVAVTAVAVVVAVAAAAAGGVAVVLVVVVLVIGRFLWSNIRPQTKPPPKKRPKPYVNADALLTTLFRDNDDASDPQPWGP